MQRANAMSADLFPPPPFLHAEHFIGGVWIDEDPKSARTVINPASGDRIGTYAIGSAALANRAIAVARAAFENSDWSRAPRQRAEAILTFSNRMQQRRDELIRILTYENGKVIPQAAAEIDICISEAKFYAGLARTIFGRNAEIMPGKLSLLMREPIGVAGIIVPWNAPATLLVRSLAPALAAGCACVIKPAPQTPLINKALIECLDGIEELPAGIVNSVNESGAEVGKALVQSESIDVISFTGSSATGKAIMAAASGSLKRLSLELGGKSPTIVFPEADLERAVSGITRGATIISGQMCVAITRVLVHRDNADEVAERLKASFANVNVGPGYLSTSQMGPLIDRANQQRAMTIVDEAKRTARVLLAGSDMRHEHPNGAFVTPTLFEAEDVSSPLIQEEHFAPIVSLERFSSEDEAVARANATRYGLAASIWSSDVDRVLRVSRRLEAGTVWVNCHNQMSPESETGGYKESGVGRLHGVEGLDDFLETKNIYFDIAGQS